MIFATALAWLLVGAQIVAQPVQDVPPAAKPVPAETARTADKTAKQTAGSADETAAQDDQSAKQGGQARANRAVLEPVAFEQARYVKRLAQLERIQAIANEKNNTLLHQQAETLRIRNEEHHSNRLAALRTKHGADKVDAALAWIDTRAKERGSIGIVGATKDQHREAGTGADSKAREEAKKRKERTEDMKEKAKEKVKGEPKP